ncbi:MAG TPA: hypothetical protein VI819_04835 [Patescibacteria group bacterium]|nr:hypothetical protein [Patescibacteria group bacterium]
MIDKFRKLFSWINKNKITSFTLLLTLPALLIWVLSVVTYFWQTVSAIWFSKLPPQIYLLILLLMPFISLNLTLWFFFKTKKDSYKKISIVNIALLIFLIGFSALLSN